MSTITHAAIRTHDGPEDVFLSRFRELGLRREDLVEKFIRLRR